MLIQNFFLQLVLILFAARVLGEAAARFNIPSVIGELFAGILIGPSLLGLVEPTATIKLLAEIGIILLLFEVGLETDLSRLAKTGMKPFIVAVGGVTLPFLLGFFVSYSIFDLNLLVSLFIASTLTATSIGITVRVLTDLKKQASDEAQIVLGAAVVDDIIGIIILSMLYEFSMGGGINFFNVGKIILFIGLFLVFAPVAAKFISHTIKYYEERSDIPGLLPTTIVSLLLLFAWLAHQIGAPELLGGFAAGLALSRQFFLPLGAFIHSNPEFSHKVENQMKPIVHLFTPIFFVTVGLSLNLREIDWSSPFIWSLSLLILLVAVVGKLCSGFLLLKDSKWIKWAVGLAMIPRGEVGLIFAEVGRSSQIFNDDIYAAMIIVIAITTVMAPFMMRFFYAYQDKHSKEPRQSIE
ncbi:sodium:proton antiporter [Candidatus Protochlamydia naegleriophila]|uniref:Sodium:proton antiporter n=1 Tax=Candidatus Protochlamydia naegleriophila TaxID=389348 RepID=A0A0U5JAM8_9BACT|nr:cation:proton antiporter [Candidatus Protochlamydia naegleriophila]CUI15730.1 sodium:proton antiporter [Candidatus Protochlamydia naegleriophila]